MMTAFKPILLLIVFTSLCAPANAQDEITFKIAKLRTPHLYPDTFRHLEWEHLYPFVLRDVDPASIQSVSISRGKATKRDSVITISLLESPKGFLDSAMLTVCFKPNAHVDKETLTQKFYIMPIPPKISPRVNNGKSGLYIRWIHGDLHVLGYKKGYHVPIIHHIVKSRITEISNPSIWFQNYSSCDTSAKNFDSMYVSLTIRKKIHRYHMKGSTISPELMDAVESMHLGDQIRLRLYYRDLDTETERRKNILFKISIINYDERVI